MKFTLTIESDGAAMNDYPVEGVMSILAETSADLANGWVSGPIHDVNGNKMGRWELVG